MEQPKIKSRVIYTVARKPLNVKFKGFYAYVLRNLFFLYNSQTREEKSTSLKIAASSAETGIVKTHAQSKLTVTPSYCGNLLINQQQ
ncbi:hypothetical protein CS542_00345 [Pedobacter sp. IW39]|nr:hypothetical protein CS542_00345 [Pedobacter sp. IW39]